LLLVRTPAEVLFFSKSWMEPHLCWNLEASKCQNGANYVSH
jgi:hypothetical protein